MDTKILSKYITYASYFFGFCLIVVLGLSVVALEAGKKPPEVRNRIMNDLKNMQKIYTSLPKPWPPQMNKTYTNFTLTDQDGENFRLSDYRGKVLIIENIDMTNPESQVLSGARQYGVYGGKEMKLDTITREPIEKIISQYTEGKITLPNPDILLIKVIYYNEKSEQPKPADAANWAKHFNLQKAAGAIVAVPDQDMRTTFTSAVLPGYQLVDRAFTLRVDSSGEKPKHSLEMTLIPLIPKLL